MRNYVQKGDTLTLAAPAALTSGEGFVVGSIFAIAKHAAANGASVEAAVTGVFDLPALATDVNAVGEKLYWDNTNKRVTETATGNTLIGVAVAAKASGATIARVRLNGNF